MFLTTLTTLFYFATIIKMKPLFTLTMLFYFNKIEIKSLTMLTTLFSLTTLTSLFYFTTIQMKSLITPTALFYFIILIKTKSLCNSLYCDLCSPLYYCVTMLTTLFHFATIKTKSLTTHTTLIYLTPIE